MADPGSASRRVYLIGQCGGHESKVKMLSMPFPDRKWLEPFSMELAKAVGTRVRKRLPLKYDARDYAEFVHVNVSKWEEGKKKIDHMTWRDFREAGHARAAWWEASGRDITDVRINWCNRLQCCMAHFATSDLRPRGDHHIRDTDTVPNYNLGSSSGKLDHDAVS